MDRLDETGAPSPKKAMQTIEERARSYARQAEDFQDEREMKLAELDYIAGAKEEHILLTE